MGYYVTLAGYDLTIPASKVHSCLCKLNAMSHTKGGYSWVSEPTHPSGFSDIMEAFEAWRYTVREERNGDITLESFDGEKLVDDDIFWSTVADFVEDGAYMDWEGEDNERWRYKFEGGKVIYLTGRIVYDQPGQPL